MKQLLALLENKKILILGFGREGQSSYTFLRHHFPEKVLGIADQTPQEISDTNTTCYFGSDYLDHLADYNLIIKTPGIPGHLPQLATANVTSQTKLFFSVCRDRIIGVTGTKGKSTTSSLIFHMLQQAGRDVILLGNIGAPALDYLEHDRPDRWYVFELSAHQLSDLTQSPHIAVLLNIFREHLDYYKTMEQYIAAKARITTFQSETDFFVFNADQKEVYDIASATKAKVFGFSQQEIAHLEKIIAITEIPLNGSMNRNNVMAAVTVGQILAIPTPIIAEAIRQFSPLPYRLEKIGIYKNITFYDDALATIPEATIAALESFGESTSTVIAGGFDRGQNFQTLAQCIIDHHIHNVILFPTTGERIWQEIEKRIKQPPQHFFVHSMEEAVQLAYQHTTPGMLCLLSPAAPSFGLFKDYKDRSERYRTFVQRIGEKL